jgi:hypothetical protein
VRVPTTGQTSTTTITATAANTQLHTSDERIRAGRDADDESGEIIDGFPG